MSETECGCGRDWPHIKIKAAGCDRPRRPALATALDDLRAKIIELHRPSTDHGATEGPYCVGCSEAGDVYGAPAWPCRTVLLLEGWMHDCSERGHPVWWPWGQQCLFCWTRMEVTHEPGTR